MHMDNLSRDGVTTERFTILHETPHEERVKRENRARSRIANAAHRLRIQVTTHVAQDAYGPYIEGRIKSD